MFYNSRHKHPNFLGLYGEVKVEKVVDKINILKKARQRKTKKIIKLTAKIIAGVFLLSLITLIIAIVIYAKTIRLSYDNALAGKADLEQAYFFATQQKFNDCYKSATRASNEFAVVETNINKAKWLPITYLPIAREQFNYARYLIKTGSAMSSAVNNICVFGDNLSSLLYSDKKFSALTPAAKAKILQAIYDNQSALTEAQINLDQAYDNLKQLENKKFIISVDEKLFELKDKVEQARAELAKVIPLAKLSVYLAGYPQQTNYLLIFQNRDELRPTGGFVGTYGLATVNGGEVTRLDTHDIYNLDKYSEGKLNILPPMPLQQYTRLKTWYMRDANWWPDWPTSAKKLEWFYQAENKNLVKPDNLKDFDVIAAINPDFISDLLTLTGDINIRGVNYNASNFVNLLQEEVEINYQSRGIPKNQRKEVVGEITKELKKRLLDLPFKQWPELFNKLAYNFEAKNIQLYSRNQEIQDLLAKKNWNGEMRATTGDYLMIVDTNLLALKTDAVINRKINYQIKEGADGLVARLTITYAHSGKLDWKTSAYKNYARVYVPLGSQLIKTDGFTGVNTTATEFGKTYFAGVINLDPGKIITVSLDYKLPATIKNEHSYSLLAQKQSGSRVESLVVDAGFKNKIKSYDPVSFFSQLIDGQEAIWQSNLAGDRQFSVEFSND